MVEAAVIYEVVLNLFFSVLYICGGLIVIVLTLGVIKRHIKMLVK